MRALVVALMAAAISAAPAAETAPSWVREAPGRDAFPEEDGLLVRRHVRLTLDATGRVTRSEETAVKMLQDWVAGHGLLDPRIDWNDARSEMRVTAARTYMADGTVVEARENSLVPNTAPELEWAVPYAHMRQMVVAHVGAEHGSTSVLAYEAADRRPSGVPLWGVLALASDLPVLDDRIEIETPQDVAVRWAAVGAALEPEPPSPDGGSLAFRRRDVPAIRGAELSAGREGAPRLVFSTLGDWASARSWLEERIEPAASPTPEIRARAEKIAGTGGPDAERLSKIHAFVVDGVRTVEWPAAAFDYAARPAPEVLRSSVGHRLDKAVLLVALLRSSGFDARVALAAPASLVAPEIACPPQLHEVWVRARLGAREVWLDPCAPLDRRSRAHLAGYRGLVLDGETESLVEFPDPDPSTNRAELRIEVRVEDEKGSLKVGGTADLDLGGRYNPFVGFDRTKDRWKDLASRAVSAFEGAEVREVIPAHRSEDLTALRATFSGASLEVPPSGLARVSIPRVPGAVGGRELQLWRERRTLPLVLAAPARESVELALDLPEGVEAAFVPPPAAMRNAAGSLERTVTLEGRRLTVRTEVALALRVVDPQDYAALRALLAALEEERGRTILLRRSR